eukprot:g676.t1
MKHSSTPTPLRRMRDPLASHVRPPAWLRDAELSRHAKRAKRVEHSESVNGKAVLSDAAYSTAVEAIVERDFFPDVAVLRNLCRDTSADLCAGVGGASASASASASAVAETSATAGCAAAHWSSLDRFVQRHTAEEAVRFGMILEGDQRRHRSKFNWAFEGEHRVGGLGCGDGGGHASGGESDTGCGGAAGWRARSQRLLMPCGETMSEERRQRMDAACEPRPRLGDQQLGRDNRVQAWPYRPRNALSFPPELDASRVVCGVFAGSGRGSGRGTARSGALPRRRRWLQRGGGGGQSGGRDINHAATRIEAEPDLGRDQGGEQSRAGAVEFDYAFVRMTPSPYPMAGSLNTGNTGNTGSTGNTGNTDSTDGEAWAEGVHFAARGGTDVDADVNADASFGASTAAAASPMMTWGCIDGTPLVLDPAPARHEAGRHPAHESSPRENSTEMLSPFRIAELPPRDRRAKRLAHVAAQQWRGRARRRGQACTKSEAGKSCPPRAQGQRRKPPRQPAKRFTQLSPAAQSLAARVVVGMGGGSAAKAKPW